VIKFFDVGVIVDNTLSFILYIGHVTDGAMKTMTTLVF
jgi:hypothetical protein